MQLSLLGGFELADGDAQLEVPSSASRIVAILAIAGRALPRSRVAGTLWPDATDAHAQASLRSALSRLNDRQRLSMIVTGRDLALVPTLTVDLWDARLLAHRILRSDRALHDEETSLGAVGLLSQDLLPDWDDEWIDADAQQWREIRLHALQVLALRLATEHRYVEAVDVAYAAIAVDPLRETGYAALIRTHLASGDRAAAVATFTMYRKMLTEELQSEPSPELEALLRVTDLIARRGPSVVVRAQTAVAGEDVEAFEVVATGISMEPTIRHGDTLLVSRAVAPVPGRIVVAIHQGTWVVKRLADHEGTMVLRSDNVNEQLLLSDVDIRGVVVEIHRTV